MKHRTQELEEANAQWNDYFEHMNSQVETKVSRYKEAIQALKQQK